MKPARTRPAVPPLVAALCLATFAAPLAASDAHAPAAPAAPAKAAVGTRPMASAEDPLDKLRERLAEKLGASQAAKGPPGVVHVTARPGADTAAAAAGPLGQAAAAPRRAARAAAPAHAHAPHWDYSGAGGPQHWAELKPEFAKCATGTRQSPIDIRDGLRVQLDPVQFSYQAGGFRVVDNGHTIQVNVAPGNHIEVMGRRYELQQFHFHRPSEERIDGRQFDMVAHLVHKDPEGRLAVVAVLLERGSAHPIVQSVWNNLPLEKGEELAARGTLDPARLLPPEAQRQYFTYMGSLTTPPCSEGVLWMVLKQPVPVSPEQIGIFARLYPMNARPIQSAAGRLIKESE